MKSPMIHSATLPITRILHLSAFLGGQGADVVGWGRKRSGGQEMAARKGLLWLLLEDGYLRSVEREDAPLSLVLKISASTTTQGPLMHSQNFVGSVALSPEGSCRMRIHC